MTVLLDIRNVSKAFDQLAALDNVSLQIHTNEFFAILGPSGSGKTTLLRALAGFEALDSGQIVLDGHDVADVPPNERPVNLMFQSYALFPHMSVFDNVAYGLRREKRPQAEIAQRVTSLLATVGLGDMATRRPHQLSGGQKQRVALARAIVKRPKILLLDEPLSALDRKVREDMQLELKRLQHEVGITFVVVTHDQEEAMSMSDRIAIMLDGHIEQLADPETVYEHPKTAFVAGFVGRNNFWQGTATANGSKADDGTVFVATRPEENVPTGESALSAVRPECINLSANRPDKPENSVEATVAGVSHFGDVLQYVVRSAHRDILVLVPRTNPARFAVDDRVWCSWSAEDVYLFSARQADVVMASPAHH